MTKAILIMFGLLTLSFMQKEVYAAPPQVSRTILVVGDSLSAEYGLKKGEGWVSLLEKRLAEKKIVVAVNNASISGETTAGGKSRIDSLLKKYQPSLVIIELGANDALRGVHFKNTQENLDYMVLRSIASNSKVLLVGMQIPPNFGGAYARDFSAIFSNVSKNNNIPRVEFFLKNVADISDSVSLFQSDRVHPNAKSHPIMLENVWSKLEPMLKN